MQSTEAGEAAAAAATAAAAKAAAALPQSRDYQKGENGSEQGPPAALWVQGDSE